MPCQEREGSIRTLSTSIQSKNLHLRGFSFNWLCLSYPTKASKAFAELDRAELDLASQTVTDRAGCHQPTDSSFLQQLHIDLYIDLGRGLPLEGFHTTKNRVRIPSLLVPLSVPYYGGMRQVGEMVGQNIVRIFEVCYPCP